MKGKTALWIIGCIVGGAALFILYILATMSLWNWLIPSIFNGPVLTFAQTAGLMLLVCMFGWIGFGGKGWGGRCGYGGRHHWKHKWNDKWQNMTEEERQKWKDEMNCRW